MKPLFAYVGGKTFLKEKLNQKVELVLYNNKLNTYEEWFAGGLGAFFAVAETLLKYNVKKVKLNDINENIISLYDYINKGGNYIKHLIDIYMEIENVFHNQIPLSAYSLHKTKEKEQLKEQLKDANALYKFFCNRFNELEVCIEKAAYLIFLQNHCFNGIYRENLKGQYNTPFNWEARIIEKNTIYKKIKDVETCFNQFEIDFTTKSFEEIETENNSLIYLDPPYLNEKISENKYNKTGFSLSKQYELIDKIKNNKFIYSNHADKRIIDYFNENNIGIDFETFPRKNIISASVESRKNDKLEVLITNY